MSSIPELSRSLLSAGDLVNWVPEHESQDCFTYYDRCPICGSATVAVPDSVTPGGIRACILCLSREYVVKEVLENNCDDCKGLPELRDKLSSVTSTMNSILEERDALRHIVMENDEDVAAVENENLRLRFELRKMTDLLRKRGVEIPTET